MATVFKKKLHEKSARRRRDLNPALPTRCRGSFHRAKSPLNSCLFISILENRMRINCSAHATNAKKTKQALHLPIAWIESPLSWSHKIKSERIVNRLIHCAIGTLVGMMFAKLLFFSCYTQKLLSLLYVWD
jgi:hypothetical protein